MAVCTGRTAQHAAAVTWKRTGGMRGPRCRRLSRRCKAGHVLKGSEVWSALFACFASFSARLRALAAALRLPPGLLLLDVLQNFVLFLFP